MIKRRLLLLVAVSAVLLAACLPVAEQPPPPSGGGGGGGSGGGPPPAPQPVSQYCAGSTPSSPDSYKFAVDNLRKTYTEWASADGSVPVALPDGRTLWLYGDTFIGAVNSSGVISTPHVLVSNSAVLQTGPCFKPLMGGAPLSRSAWIADPNGNQAYWPASGLIENGQLRVFLMHVQRSPFAVLGMKIATFALPGLSLVSISPKLSPTSAQRNYGTTLAVDGGYAYMYASNDQDFHVARAPIGSVTNTLTWQFWKGPATTDWSSNSGDAQTLDFQNVPTPVVGIALEAPIAGLWVVRHGNGFLGTAKLVDQFSDDVSLFTAPAPEGPWTYVSRAATTPSGVFSYGARTGSGLQGMPASPATVYSTNVPGTASTIAQYGPRFVTPANMPAPLP